MEYFNFYYLLLSFVYFIFNSKGTFIIIFSFIYAKF